MTEIKIKEIIENLIDTFFLAGKICLELREKGLIKEIKEDNTPVSNGDLEVNKIVSEKISKLTPNIPIISEEKNDNKSKEDLKDFWLIDPIDGTYDYINNLEEFTINAGLILDNKPKAGIIYAPAKKRMFYTYGEKLSFELTNQVKKKLDPVKNFNKDEIKFVSYSDKIKPQIESYHQKFNVKKYLRMKSSLKFCVIAAGEFDGYIAEPRAFEWDIAAGHAILINAGGIVTDFDGNEIFYGKKDFRNTSLILKSNNSI
tara:strand:- start:940 stop:1713 length:774 start_codon:yes stop_codon:yes gene_type:complete